MSVYDIRRENLARLLQHRGAKTHLAGRLGCTQAVISQWLRDPTERHARIIHENTARAIEAAIGLEPGSLDRATGSRAPPRIIPEVARVEPKNGADRDLVAQTVLGVMDTAARNKKKLSTVQAARLITTAYEHNAALGRYDEVFTTRLLEIIE